jgi:hypothetical protein
MIKIYVNKYFSAFHYPIKKEKHFIYVMYNVDVKNVNYT